MRGSRRPRAPGLEVALALAMLAGAASAYAEPAAQKLVPNPISGYEASAVHHSGRTDETTLVCLLVAAPVAATARAGFQPTPSHFAVAAPTATHDSSGA
jgi:hypothetical protein